MRPAVFFDRDGVLNVNHGYAYRVEDLDWIEGAREAVRAANEAGKLVVVVTNQSGIARGMYGEADFHRFMERMRGDLAAVGAHIDAVEFCPHHPEGEGHYAIDCECRKPKPGMIFEAIRELGIDPSASVLVGDSETDVEAAEAAGVRGLLFPGGDLLEFLRGAGVVRSRVR